MSKTQLQTNNTRLASLIDELKGKAAGGGSSGDESVETCAVTFDIHVDYPVGYGCYCTCLEDGVFVPKIKIYENYGSNSFTITNVVCGSLVYVEANVNSAIPGYQVSNVEEIGGYSFDNLRYIHRAYKVTASAGDTASIRIYDAD